MTKVSMIYKGVNAISGDSYFIRLSDNKTHFIHFEGDSATNKEDVVYRVKPGEVGACIFHKKQAEEFVKLSGANNLEIVKVSDILPNDETCN